MHVILIVIGLMLAVYGGGLGVLPLVIGGMIFRWGLRINREKRKARISSAPTSIMEPC